MSTKKADSLGLQFIVVITILIVFAVIYFVWLGDFRTIGEDLSDYTICKNSNFENAKFKLRLDNWVISESVGNRCKTEYIKEVPKDMELEFLSTKMAACWDQYLEGREELFFTEDNNFCAICTVFEEFEDKKQVNNLISYLMETEMPGKEGTSYFDYLTGTITKDDVITKTKDEEQRDNKLGILDLSQPQAIIFVEGKDVYPDGLVKKSAITTGVFGSIAGGIAAIGIGLCSLGVPCIFGGPLLLAVGIVSGTTIGYLIGSDETPELESGILLWPYIDTELSQIKCTVFEGQDQLEIKKF